VLAHITTGSAGSGLGYSGIAAAAGLSTATTVTDVVSLETGNRAMATITPVALRVSNLLVSGDVQTRPLTVALKAPNASTPYLQCTVASGAFSCGTDGTKEIPAGSKLIISISSPAAGAAFNAQALAIGWRETPLPD
jgi:hypothetical protein